MALECVREMQYTEMALISVTAMMLTNNIAGRRVLFILALLLLAEIDQITTLTNHISRPIEVSNSFILSSLVNVIDCYMLYKHNLPPAHDYMLFTDEEEIYAERCIVAW